MENAFNYITDIQDNMQGGDSRFNHLTQNQRFTYKEPNPDLELDAKTKKVTEKFSENMNIIANEPSLAFFRIQEHVRRCLPLLAETKQEVQDLQQQVQGACFDTEYAANAVADMHESSAHFQKVQELLKNAMFNKQQIDYDQSRREQKKLHPSMYTTTSSPDIKSANLDCDTANTPLQKIKTAIAGSEAESVNRSPKPDQARRQKHGLTRLETINSHGLGYTRDGDTALIRQQRDGVGVPGAVATENAVRRAMQQ